MLQVGGNQPVVPVDMTRVLSVYPNKPILIKSKQIIIEQKWNLDRNRDGQYVGARDREP